MYVILLVLLIVLVVGLLPMTGWHTYGYTPSGAIGVLVVVLLVLLLLGRI